MVAVVFYFLKTRLLASLEESIYAVEERTATFGIANGTLPKPCKKLTQRTF